MLQNLTIFLSVNNFVDNFFYLLSFLQIILTQAIVLFLILLSILSLKFVIFKYRKSFNLLSIMVEFSNSVRKLNVLPRLLYLYINLNVDNINSSV